MNKLLKKINDGEKPLGIFVHMLSENAVEAYARAGFDFLILDMEHSPAQTETIARCITAAEAAGIIPVVRVDSLAKTSIQKMLDAGAHALYVPQVETVEQVRAVVELAKFTPVGKRGFCHTRDGGWGFDSINEGGIPEYMRRANRDALLIPQCETKGCLENIEEIAAIEGVDAIYIGPYDLSISIGVPGDIEGEVMQAALNRILEACRKAGKPCIMDGGTPELAKKRFEQGFSAVAMGLDMIKFIQSFKDMVDEARELSRDI